MISCPSDLFSRNAEKGILESLPVIPLLKSTCTGFPPTCCSTQVRCPRPAIHLSGPSVYFPTLSSCFLAFSDTLKYFSFAPKFMFHYVQFPLCWFLKFDQCWYQPPVYSFKTCGANRCLVLSIEFAYFSSELTIGIYLVFFPKICRHVWVFHWLAVLVSFWMNFKPSSKAYFSRQHNMVR